MRWKKHIRFRSVLPFGFAELVSDTTLEALQRRTQCNGANLHNGWRLGLTGVTKCASEYRIGSRFCYRLLQKQHKTCIAADLNLGYVSLGRTGRVSILRSISIYYNHRGCPERCPSGAGGGGWAWVYNRMGFRNPEDKEQRFKRRIQDGRLGQGALQWGSDCRLCSECHSVGGLLANRRWRRCISSQRLYTTRC